MNLDDRKRYILKAIINDYIDTAEPVGSRTIVKKYSIGLSSATIRNEMADLEDMGYLEQPHTSSGRIPSDKGYRVYVDYLMNDEELPPQEIDIIKSNIYKIAAGELDKIIEDTSKLLSMLTNYTALAMEPQTKSSTVKYIKLLDMESTCVMAIIVTNTGIVKNVMVKLSKPITQNKLNTINNILNDKLKGLTVEEINIGVLNDVQKGLTGYDEILSEIIPVLYDSLNCNETEKIHFEGSSNIFNYPEYNAIEKAKAFISVLDRKDFLFKLLSNDSDNVKVTIGHENNFKEIDDCSLITATYKIGDNSVGTIGIIGPTRMYYSKVLALIKCITNCLNEILTGFYLE